MATPDKSHWTYQSNLETRQYIINKIHSYQPDYPMFEQMARKSLARHTANMLDSASWDPIYSDWPSIPLDCQLT